MIVVLLIIMSLISIMTIILNVMAVLYRLKCHHLGTACRLSVV